MSHSIYPFLNDKYWTLPNSKSLHTAILNLMKTAESSPTGQKTLWKKEKLLVMSNFSFSLSVFKRLLLQLSENQGLLGKGLSTCNKLFLKRKQSVYFLFSTQSLQKLSSVVSHNSDHLILG